MEWLRGTTPEEITEAFADVCRPCSGGVGTVRSNVRAGIIGSGLVLRVHPFARPISILHSGDEVNIGDNYFRYEAVWEQL